MKENISYFRLAHISPLLEEELCEDLSLLDEGILMDELLWDQSILQEYPNIKDTLQLFIIRWHLTIQTYIAPDQWIEHWKKVKERIASLYLGLYFGYYKIHILYLGIASIKFILVNIAVRNRLPLKR